MRGKKVLLPCLVLLLSGLCFTVTTAKAQTQPIELSVSSWNPAQLPMIQLIEKKWAKTVEENAQGTIKFTFYWAGALVGQKDTYRSILTGVVDIGHWVLGSVPGLHTLNEFSSLPLIGWDSTYTATKVYNEMIDKFPELQAEFKGTQKLFSVSMPPNQIHMHEKSIRLPADMRGMKILAAAGWSDFVNSLGAVAVFKGPPDWYMSLQKGLVEGQFQHFPAVLGFKLEELFTSHTEAGDAGFGIIIHGFWMNEKKWNSLPPVAQKAFTDARPMIEKELLDLDYRLVDMGREAARKMGHEIIILTPEEREQWAKATETVSQKWIEKQEAKGHPGKAIYTEAKRLIKLYNK